MIPRHLMKCKKCARIITINRTETCLPCRRVKCVRCGSSTIKPTKNVCSSCYHRQLKEPVVEDDSIYG